LRWNPFGLYNQAESLSIIFIPEVIWMRNRVVDERTLFFSHMMIHVGEIAALKGVEGVKGFPF
jgi:hypothetical protein